MIVPLTCLVALVALVASSPLVPAVPSPGPSGTLSWPGSGQTYNNGKLAFRYHQVYDGNNNYLNGQTKGISITLEPINGNKNPAVQLVNGFAATAANGNTEFTAPIEGKVFLNAACGHYRFAVTEWQYYGNKLIHFRSTAPSITIKC